MVETMQGFIFAPNHAVAVTFDGDKLGDAISQVIGCRTVTVASIGHGIDLFVDDEGLLVSKPKLNLTATVLAHALGSPQVLFGTAVAFGSDDETGETVGLTEEQRALVTRAVCTRPEAEGLDKLCESLAPFPGVVALLRAAA